MLWSWLEPGSYYPEIQDQLLQVLPTFSRSSASWLQLVTCGSKLWYSKLNIWREICETNSFSKQKQKQKTANPISLHRTECLWSYTRSQWVLHWHYESSMWPVDLNHYLPTVTSFWGFSVLKIWLWITANFISLWREIPKLYLERNKLQICKTYSNYAHEY